MIKFEALSRLSHFMRSFIGKSETEMRHMLLDGFDQLRNYLLIKIFKVSAEP